MALLGSLLLNSCMLAKLKLSTFTYSENVRAAVLSARFRLKLSRRGAEVSGITFDALTPSLASTMFPPFPLTSLTAVEFREIKVSSIVVARPS